jgi:hypothetical protein
VIRTQSFSRALGTLKALTDQERTEEMEMSFRSEVSVFGSRERKNELEKFMAELPIKLEQQWIATIFAVVMTMEEFMRQGRDQFQAELHQVRL